MTITSKDNEKVRLIRRLSQRKQREREGLFATEGEDLLEAGIAAGHEPRFILCAAGSGLPGEETDPELLGSVSALGSGTRLIAVWEHVTQGPPTGPTVYLHGVSDPGNVGSIIRTTAALTEASVALGPGCADPFGPKALRASMGSVFALKVAQAGFGETPRPRLALVAHDGAAEPPAEGTTTVCLGAERAGLPSELVSSCEATWTIPVRPGAESLGVAAAAAIALGRIGSLGRKGSG